MALASLTKIVDVPMEKFFAAITRYEDYPQFVTGTKRVEEVERKAPGHARAKYYANMLGKDFWYALEHFEDAATGKMTWTLVDSDLLKVDNGSWTLKSVDGGKTEVTYGLEIEFKIWVPGPVLKTLTKTSLPLVISEFEKRAKGA